MIEAKPFPEEEKRLASLNSLHLLDTPIQERFERITRMVRRALNVPIAIFNLIDEDRQHYKSVQGLATTNAPLEAAFCTHALHEKNMLLVPDAKKDQRFFDNPFVTSGLNVRFYAGCPVRTPDGMPIGTLCAIDTEPRDMSAEQLDALRDLAAMVETELKLASVSRAQKNLIEELDSANRLAMIDPLTRLWNRTGMTNLLVREWSEALRNKKPVTIVMGDIDYFKKINDTYGHPFGDAVIRTVGKRILENLRNEDAVGRVGGEEFLIILTDCVPEKVFDTVERIRASISDEKMRIDSELYDVTMSFGAATAIPDDTITYDELIKRADKALYEAKNNGRNRVEVAQ